MSAREVSLSWMHRYVSRRQAYILLNLIMLFSLWITGTVTQETNSIVAAVLVIGIMNVVAWRSAKEFPEWK